MSRGPGRACFSLPVLLLAVSCSSQHGLQRALNRGTGTVHLPPGITEIHSEIVIPAGAHDLEITGSANTVLRAADDFRGRALIACSGAQRVRMHGFTIDGNRTFRDTVEMAPPENAFRLMYRNNGLWFDRTRSIAISNVRFRQVAGFAVLISRSSDIAITGVSVFYSGLLNRRNRNNSTGGIVIEEGSSNFRVQNCTFRNILGNGLWTHSLYTSERNHDGLFESNDFDTIGRDAIQVGHATGIRVVGNHGRHIGFPEDVVDSENGGTPVAIDTAGNVGDSSYRNNRFEEVDGKCFDLDGFHDGEVVSNSCVNPVTAGNYKFGHYALVMNDSNPDMHARNVAIIGNEFNGMKFGGIYVVGGPHRIEQNRLLNLNLAHCNDNPAIPCLYMKDQPDLLRSGIYLGAGVKKQDPTVHNVIRRNDIEGYKIRQHCVVASPAVSLAANDVGDNRCWDMP
jgi:hypothetical protein